ncbi:MAG: hypothetical protein JNM00_15805 [Flavobacteriales bacterium]|nr:hypothetical protein [Flavobacteriales bacterium]
MSPDDSKELILRMIREKSVLKQDVYHNTLGVFKQLKSTLSETIEGIRKDFGGADTRVEFHFKDKGDFQAEIKIGGDVIIFQLNTNVFQFDNTHSVWRSGYIKDNEANSYVGIINIYNFLADSFKYQRSSDIGYLIGRLFINRENHFMVQGKRQLGYLYNDFINSVLDQESLKSIVNSAILYTLDFDMYTPPYEAMQELTVQDIQILQEHSGLGVAKRLGFRFGLDDSAL